MTTPEFITSSEISATRCGFHNFTWTHDAIKDWEEVWYSLWNIGIKWEWQNSDRYARRFGQVFTVFSVHDDAVRLDMTVPLPGRDVILEIHDHLLDRPEDDFAVDHATNLIRNWITKYAQ